MEKSMLAYRSVADEEALKYINFWNVPKETKDGYNTLLIRTMTQVGKQKP